MANYLETVRFAFPETVFDITKQSLWLNAPAFFPSHPEVLQRGSYHIQTNSSREVIMMFLNFIKSGGALEITDENSPILSQLANEFGLSAIAAECRRFQKRSQRVISFQWVNHFSSLSNSIGQLGDLDTLSSRIATLAETVPTIDRKLGNLELIGATQSSVSEVSSDLQQLRDRVSMLEPCGGNLSKRTIKDSELPSHDIVPQSTITTLRLQLDALQPHFRKSRSLLPVGDLDFTGIFSFLTEKHNGNVHEKNIVNITASSVYMENGFWDAKNIVDPAPETVYGSLDAPNQWIQFDFKQIRVRISTYAVRTGCYPIDGCHIKSWVIEASNDGQHWREYDRQSDSNVLNRPRAKEKFVVKGADECRFLRLRQIGKNHNGTDVLELSGLEFFGLISEPA